MTSNNILLQPYFYYIILPLAVILGTISFYYFNRLRKQFVLKHALTFSLYEIVLPRAVAEENKILKDLVAKMEQFYVGMSNLDSHFALELVSPATEKETNFYIAIPRDKISFLENQIRSVFPDAEIREEVSDYNIFKYRGFNESVVLNLKEQQVLPLKTYEELATDPIEVLANVFSSLSSENEGATLQIIINPAENKFQKSIEHSINLLESGERIKTALKGGESFFESFVKTFSGNKPKEPEKKEILPQQEEGRRELIELLRQKTSRQIMQANIRLVSSANTKQKAQNILSEMKSSFSQFTHPKGNSFVARPVGKLSLRNFFYNFSYRLFNRDETLYLNTAELTSIFHFPSHEIFAPKMKYLRLKKVEPPTNLTTKEGVLLGKNHFRDIVTDVKMAEDDRRKHLYIVGQTGTGKSVLIKNMILQDIKNGKGLCFIDPHGDSIEEILGQIPADRQKDVIYFDPANTERPFGLNILEYDSQKPEQKTFIVNELLNIFQKLYGAVPESLGPVFEQYFRNSALLVMEDPASGSTLLEISRVLAESEFRKLKLSKSKNPVINNFWLEAAEKAGGESALANIVPYITSKFDTFLANEFMRPILCQEKSTLNFREAMDNGKILLINLSKGRLGELNAYLLGMLLIGKIFMSAMSRVDISENQRKDFYLYIDEFQNVTTVSIAQMLSEARKYRLDLILTHQFIGQLPEEIRKAVFGNVGSMVAFRVGEEDAEFLSHYFEPVFSKENLMNTDNYNAYIKLLINGQPTRPFNLATYPPETSDSQTAEQIKGLSAAQYGRPRAEVEAEINKKYFKSS